MPAPTPSSFPESLAPSSGAIPPVTHNDGRRSSCGWITEETRPCVRTRVAPTATAYYTTCPLSRSARAVARLLLATDMRSADVQRQLSRLCAALASYINCGAASKVDALLSEETVREELAWHRKPHCGSYLTSGYPPAPTSDAPPVSQCPSASDTVAARSDRCVP